MNTFNLNQTLKNDSLNSSRLIIFDGSSNGFWGIHDRDIPILIGAAAGN